MTRIYKKSSGVHIWLGEEADNSSLAMDLVKQLSASPLRGPGDKEIIYPNLAIDQKILHWRALTALFQRPYWNRVLVRQEVATPKSATVQCGNKTCRFGSISTTADLINALNKQLGYQALRHEALEMMDSASTNGDLRTSCYARVSLLSCLRKDAGNSEHFSKTKFLDLKDLLFHTWPCNATDMRDKVFSMLGLSDPEVYSLRPDYRLSVHETLTAAARCIISRTLSLDLLSSCQNPDRLHRLPSWVPNPLDDWKALPFDTEIPMTWWNDNQGATDFIFEGELGERSSVLRARGSKQSSILALSEDRPEGYHTIKQLDTLYAKWRAFVTHMHSNPDLDRPSKQQLEIYYVKHQNDDSWLRFLSGWADLAHNLRYAEDGISLLPDEKPIHNHNPRMVESILLPKADEETSIKVDGKKKIHSNLRKFGIGRTICLLEGGHIGLVPADAKIGDEICIFCRISFPYVLRNIGGDKYVLVGEACE
jgi:hypothetical protein